MHRTGFDAGSIAALLRQTEANLSVLNQPWQEPRPFSALAGTEQRISAPVAASSGECSTPAPPPLPSGRPGGAGAGTGGSLDLEAQVLQLRAALEENQCRAQAELRSLLGAIEQRTHAYEDQLRTVGDTVQARAERAIENLVQHVNGRLRELEREFADRGDRGTLEDVCEGLRRLQYEAAGLDGRVQRCLSADDLSARLRDFDHAVQQRLDDRLAGVERRVTDGRAQLESTLEAVRDSLGQRTQALEQRIWEQADRGDAADSALRRLPESAAFRELQEEARAQAHAVEVQQRRLVTCEAKLAKLQGLEAKMEFIETQTTQQVEEHGATTRGLGDVTQRLSQKVAATEQACQRVETQHASLEARFHRQMDEDRSRTSTELEALQQRMIQHIDERESRLQRSIARTEREIAQQLSAQTSRASEDGFSAQRQTESRLRELEVRSDALVEACRQHLDRLATDLRAEARANTSNLEQQLERVASELRGSSSTLVQRAERAAEEARSACDAARRDVAKAAEEAIALSERGAEQKSTKGLAELRGLVEGLKAEVGQKQAAYDESLGALEHRYTMMIATRGADADSLKVRLEALEARVVETQVSTVRAQTGVDALKGSVAGLDGLRSCVSGLEGNLSSLEEQVRARAHEWSADAEASKSRAEAAQGRISDIVGTVQRLQAAFEGLQASMVGFDGMRGAVARLEGGLAAAEEQLRARAQEWAVDHEASRGRTDAVQARVSDLAGVVQRLQVSCDSIRAGASNFESLQKLVASLQSGVGEMEEQLQAKSHHWVADAEATKARLDATSARVVELASSVQRAETLRTRVASFESSHAVLEDKLRARTQEWEVDAETTKGRLDALQSRISDLGASIQRAEGVRASVTCLETNLASQEEQSRLRAQELASDIEAWKGRAEAAHARIADLSATVKGLRISDWEVEAETTKGRLDALQSRISDVGASIQRAEGLRASVTCLETNFASQEEQSRLRMQELASDIEASKGRAEAAHTRIADLSATVQGLRSSVQSVQVSIGEMEDQRLRMVIEAKPDGDLAKDRADVVLARVSDLANTVQRLQNSIDGLRTGVTSLEGLRNTVVALESNVSALDEQLRVRSQEWSADLEAGKSRTEASQARLSELTGNVKRLQNSSEGLRASVAGLEARGENSHAAISSLEVVVQSLQASVACLRERAAETAMGDASVHASMQSFEVQDHVMRSEAKLVERTTKAVAELRSELRAELLELRERLADGGRGAADAAGHEASALRIDVASLQKHLREVDSQTAQHKAQLRSLEEQQTQTSALDALREQVATLQQLVGTTPRTPTSVPVSARGGMIVRQEAPSAGSRQPTSLEARLKRLEEQMETSSEAERITSRPFFPQPEKRSPEVAIPASVEERLSQVALEAGAWRQPLDEIRERMDRLGEDVGRLVADPSIVAALEELQSSQLVAGKATLGVQQQAMDVRRRADHTDIPSALTEDTEHPVQAVAAPSAAFEPSLVDRLDDLERSRELFAEGLEQVERRLLHVERLATGAALGVSVVAPLPPGSALGASAALGDLSALEDEDVASVMPGREGAAFMPEQAASPGLASEGDSSRDFVFDQGSFDAASPIRPVRGAAATGGRRQLAGARDIAFQPLSRAVGAPAPLDIVEAEEAAAGRARGGQRGLDLAAAAVRAREEGRQRETDEQRQRVEAVEAAERAEAERREREAAERAARAEVELRRSEEERRQAAERAEEERRQQEEAEAARKAEEERRQREAAEAARRAKEELEQLVEEHLAEVEEERKSAEAAGTHTGRSAQDEAPSKPEEDDIASSVSEEEPEQIDSPRASQSGQQQQQQQQHESQSATLEASAEATQMHLESLQTIGSQADEGSSSLGGRACEDARSLADETSGGKTSRAADEELERPQETACADEAADGGGGAGGQEAQGVSVVSGNMSGGAEGSEGSEGSVASPRSDGEGVGKPQDAEHLDHPAEVVAAAPPGEDGHRIEGVGVVPSVGGEVAAKDGSIVVEEASGVSLPDSVAKAADAAGDDAGSSAASTPASRGVGGVAPDTVVATEVAAAEAAAEGGAPAAPASAGEHVAGHPAQGVADAAHGSQDASGAASSATATFHMTKGESDAESSIESDVEGGGDEGDAASQPYTPASGAAAGQQVAQLTSSEPAVEEPAAQKPSPTSAEARASARAMIGEESSDDEGAAKAATTAEAVAVAQKAAGDAAEPARPRQRGGLHLVAESSESEDEEDIEKLVAELPGPATPAGRKMASEAARTLMGLGEGAEPKAAPKAKAGLMGLSGAMSSALGEWAAEAKATGSDGEEDDDGIESMASQSSRPTPSGSRMASEAARTLMGLGSAVGGGAKSPAGSSKSPAGSSRSPAGSSVGGGSKAKGNLKGLSGTMSAALGEWASEAKADSVPQSPASIGKSAKAALGNWASDLGLSPTAVHQGGMDAGGASDDDGNSWDSSGDGSAANSPAAAGRPPAGSGAGVAGPGEEPQEAAPAPAGAELAGAPSRAPEPESAAGAQAAETPNAGASPKQEKSPGGGDESSEGGYDEEFASDDEVPL